MESCTTCGAPLPAERQDESLCDDCFARWVAENAEAQADTERLHERAHGPEVG